MTRAPSVLQTFLAVPILVCAPALAAEERWFVGAGAGLADFEKGNFSGDDRFLRAAGGWRLNPHLALEGAWIDVGEVSDTVRDPDGVAITQDTLTVRGRGLTLGPVLSWSPLAPVELSLRFGLSVLDVDRSWSGGTVIDPELAADTGSTDSAFFAGARIAGRLGQALWVGLNLDRYELEGVDVDATYVDVRIRF
jgi:hypothetical protein